MRLGTPLEQGAARPARFAHAPAARARRCAARALRVLYCQLCFLVVQVYNVPPNKTPALFVPARC